MVFFYSVATLTYIYMTLSLVDEGHYSAGVWLSGYSCGFGLLCCLLATMCPGWHSRAQLLTNDTLSYTPIDDLSPLLRSNGLVTPVRQTAQSYGSHSTTLSSHNNHSHSQSRLWRKQGDDVERAFRTAEIELSPTTTGGDSRLLLVTS